MLRTSERALERQPNGAGAIADLSAGRVRRGRIARRLVRGLVQIAVVAGLGFVFFLRVPQVEGRSMQPTIEGGTHVLINTLAYGVAIGPWTIGGRPIQRGDIVAFEQGSGDDRRVLLKRVVALPGETLAMRDGAVRLDGRVLDETYDPALDRSNLTQTTVPAGYLFVLGDNRGESDDSRSFGPVAQSSVIGKAVMIIWPVNRAKRLP